MPPPCSLRLATLDEIPALNDLIAASVRILHVPYYSHAQRESAIGSVFGVDTQLILDGTYIAARSGEALAGCGGWSKRGTVFGGDHGPARQDTLLDPVRDPARIRAFFIHPDFVRRGIGAQILRACEDAAATDGFSRFELAATLAGEPFFRAHGYVAAGPFEVPLPDGQSLTVVRMYKQAV